MKADTLYLPPGLCGRGRGTYAEPAPSGIETGIVLSDGNLVEIAEMLIKAAKGE